MSTERVAIPFSGGLQREVGAPQAPAGSMENLVDCYIRKGKLTIRRGVAGALSFDDTNGTAITHVLGGQTLRGQRMTLVVGYQGDSNASDFGKVFVYQMDANADVSKRIGTWFTVSDPANDPVPTIVTAESFGRAFFAHDQYRINKRAATQVFDPFTGGQLEDVTADLNNDGTSDPVRFRGVVSHLDYLFGWGYGTVDEDRAEIVRVSRPGAPRQFDPNWYFIPGSRRDPTTAAVPAGGNLLVLKEAETHVIQGSGRDNFGIERIDEHFGCLDPRLAVSVRGTAFFWSSEGPRASQGGVSQSVSNALALKEEDPSGLVAEGNLNDAFAQYIPEEEIVLFQFGQRGYALSIRQESQGWSYWSFDFEPYSAFISHGAGAAVIDGKPADSRPPGNPVFVEAPKSSEPGEVSVEWNNIGEDGDEWVEIWLRSLVPLFEDWRMDTDSDNDGVVDGFTSNTSNASGSTFSLDSVSQGSISENLQKIALTSDNSTQGTAEVRRDESDVTDGDNVRALVEAWADNLTDAQGVLRLEFYNASDTLLDSTETTFTDTNQQLREATFTAPSNTDYVRVICRVEATANDGTGDGWFHDLVLHKEGDRGSWERDRSVPVETTDPQSATVTGRGAATVYETALRHRRSIYYTSGYDSDNPDNWPVEAKGITAMGADAPTLDKTRWFRDSSDNEGVEVVITLSDDLNQDLNEAADNNKNAFIQLWRDLGQTGSFTRIAEKLPNDWSGTTLTITDENFAADGSDGEQNADYKVTAFVDNEESAFSKTTTQWVGPPAPSDLIGHSAGASIETLDWWDINYAGIDASDLVFQPTGDKMYVVHSIEGLLLEFNLSPSWDIPSNSLAASLDLTDESLDPRGVAFKPDGNRVYISSSIDAHSVLEYSLTTAWDVSTASFVQEFSVDTDIGVLEKLWFKPDGAKMYVVGFSPNEVAEYNLSTPWDVSTASFVQKTSVATEDHAKDIQFKPDGEVLFVSERHRLLRYSLSTPWDISTASLTDTAEISVQTPDGFYVKAPGARVFGVHGFKTVALFALPSAWSLTGDTSTLEWTNAIGEIPDLARGYGVDALVEVQTKNTTDGESSFTREAIEQVDTDSGEKQSYEITGEDPGDNVDAKVRHITEIANVRDQSQYTSTVTVTI